jgi:hypothetical protein
VFAAAAPFFVWFLATVAALAQDGSPAIRQTAAVAYGCGIAFVAVFLVDVTALAVAALRPGNMVRHPELAQTLQDVEFIAMGVAVFLAAAVMAEAAVLVLRHRAIWPRWVGWVSVVCAAAYALRVGTLFGTGGPFAADGVLGLFVPVVAFLTWLFTSSVVLARITPGDR